MSETPLDPPLRKNSMSFLDRLFGRTDRRKPSPSRQTAGSLLERVVPTYAIIDVETTGLSPKAGRILELAVVRVDAHGVIVDEWTSRFNPEGPVGATHIHGITDADVADAPLFRDVAGDIARRLKGLPVAAHNARFDLAFLRSEFTLAGWELPWMVSYCTLNGSYHYLPDMDRRRLADCCWATGVRLTNAHSALGDARATAGLLRYYLGGDSGREIHRDLLDLPQRARALSWPSAPVREPLKGSVAATPVSRRPIRVSPPRPTQPPLLQQLSGLSLLDVLDEGAPEGTMTYLETLLEALEDGEISHAEAVVLNDYAAIYELNAADIRAANRAFVLALAHRALDDGHVSSDERSQLNAVAEMLDVDSAAVIDIIRQADASRSARLGAALRALPEDWTHGEPLRVGDKVAFTGCDEAVRERLERRASELGVRVMGNVSRMTAMLVSDGSFAGTKFRRAQELNIRLVDPAMFETLLVHLQPAEATSTNAARSASLGAPERARALPDQDASVASTVYTGPSPALIRKWALENGYSVGVRGRLPQEVVEAFHTAAAGAAT
ncbi:exonuclease domain-containing protein [Agromyces sp. NPDC055661]